VPVVVRNKQGQTIGALTKEDFQLFDKGKAQIIVSFSAVSHSGNVSNGMAAPAEDSSANKAVEASGGAIAKPKPQRSVLYLFDDLNAAFADFASVRAAMDRHIRGLTTADQAAIYTFSGRPQLDFTSDRDKLLDTVAKLRSSLADVTADAAKSCPDINYYLADLIINQGDQRAKAGAVSHTVLCDGHIPAYAAEVIVMGESQKQLTFAPHQSRMSLRTLRLAVKRLSEMPGERLIVLCSPGFFETRYNEGDMQQVLKLATQANVTISALNVRGLYSNEADASFDNSDTNKNWRQYRLQGFQAQENILEDLARGTGGVFIHNNDGFREALDRLTKPPEFSYVLGFTPANSKPDGSFHAIKIRLANEKGVSIEARRGYYALQQDAVKESARLEVDDALFSRNQVNQIPVVLQTGYIEPNKGDPTVTVAVKVDLKSLRFRLAKERNLDTLMVVSALFNEDGSYLTGTTKTVNLELRNQTLAADPSVTLHFAFPVKRGAYVIRLVVRDAQSGAMTTFTRPEKII
jgi:VWFA-related protein